MKIQVTIEADSVKEYQQVLEELRGTHSVKTELTVDATEIAKQVADPHTEPAKKPASKKKPAPKKEVIEKEEAFMDSTSDTETSETGKNQEPTDSEKSATAGQYPNATKADVQKAMKSLLNEGKRDVLTTAFDRFNATKLSDLKEEDYSAFLTDLEVLAGEK